MYTIVVADDEEELRRAILRRVDWTAIGFRVVGEAENGIEALELVEKTEPDLLLTDISMPFISGIELARQVREIRPTIHIAFLSGYDDFKYAQQAIQYNIISYMLKPISMEELTRELVQIKEKIDARFRAFTERRNSEMGIHNFVIPLLLDSYSSSLMEEAQLESREQELNRRAIECGLFLDNQHTFRYVVIAVNILDENGVNMTTQASVHSVDSILKKYVKYFSFYAEGRVISLLIATASAFDRYLYILVEEIVQSIERMMRMHGSVGVSRPRDTLVTCHDAYREAMNAISYSNNTDSDVHYIADEERAETYDLEKIIKNITEVENLIRGGTLEELKVYLQIVFREMQQNNISKDKMDLFLLQLLSSLYRIAYAFGEGNALASLEESSFLGKLSFFDGMFQGTEQKIYEFCVKTKELLSENRKKSGNILCEQTLAMIEQQFAAQELSLVSISSEISVSPNYLSALIKKQTGSTFIDLLTKKRMEAAKEYLLCTPMKIREISEKCGYSEQHYFSYCFKKYFGISPNALRTQESAANGSSSNNNSERKQ